MASSACVRTLAACITAAAMAGCAGAPKAPQKPSPAPDGPKLSAAQTDRFQAATQAMEAGNWDRAANTLRALLADGVDTAAVHANLGTTEMARGNDDAAIAALEAAVERNPDLAPAQTRLALLHRRAGRFAEAERAYKAALSADTDYRHAHLNLGILYDVYLGESARALQHYKRFQALAPEEDEEVALWIADLERRLQSP